MLNLSKSPLRWRKVLYDNPGTPDNYSQDFLADLRINLFLEKLNLIDVIIDSGSLFQQLCHVSVFVAVYFYLLLNWISPGLLCSALFSLLLLGYAAYWACKGKHEKRLSQIAFEIRTGIVFFIFCFLLAPILHTLLASVSTDSIYIMTTSFLIVYWILFDYTLYRTDQRQLSGSNTISLSSAILAALCLASRLPGPYHTFALLAAAVIFLALWPTFANRIRARGGRRSQLFLTCLSTYVMVAVVYPIAVQEASFEYKCLIASGYVVSALCLNILGPCLLIYFQKWKKNIHGPWDEAIVG